MSIRHAPQRFRFIALGVAFVLMLTGGWWLTHRVPTLVTPPLPPDTGLSQVESSRVLRVAMDASYPPFAVALPNGTVQGFDVDLANAIGRMLDVHVQVINLTEDSLPDALVANQADVVISEMRPNPAVRLAYSEPYYDAGQVLLVSAHDTAVQSLQDLRGRKVGVELGSDADEYTRQLPAPAFQVQHYDSVNLAVQALLAGQVAGVITDAPSAADFQKAGEAVRVAGPLLTSDPYVIGAAPQNLSLIDAMNKCLETLRSNGTLETLIRKDI